MFASLVGSTIFFATTTVSFLIPTAHASSTTVAPQPLHEMAADIAIEHNIPKEWLFNLVDSESDWNSSAINDHGCSIGLTQINICQHKDVTKAEAFDPYENLEWAATQIAKGNGWWWTSGNCYSYVWTKVGGQLPRMADIIPNTSTPHAGQVAIFYYTDKETGEAVKHVAYIVSAGIDTITIKEANRLAFVIDTRTIPTTDPHLVGFWDPRGYD